MFEKILKCLFFITFQVQWELGLLWYLVVTNETKLTILIEVFIYKKKCQSYKGLEFSTKYLEITLAWLTFA